MYDYIANSKQTESDIKIPPVELIHYTCGMGSVEEYIRSGEEVAAMISLAASHYDGDVADLGPILDFGCGSGRIFGAMDFGQAVVTGCDVGTAVAAFSSKSYPHIRIMHTSLMPPLPFENSEFRLIYSFSVFSHLNEKVEDLWLEELYRVGEKNCLYLITVQGEWMIEATLQPTDQEEIRRVGFGFKKVHSRNNTELDFPEYYESSYHTNDYINLHWSKYFNIISIIKGDDPRRYLFGNLEFVSKGGSVPDFRPMGQDLVIARRRQK